MSKLLQNHQKFTMIGFALLVITYLIASYHEDYSGIEYNYAYVSGIAMIIVFLTSFGIFYKDRFKPKNE